MSEKQIEYKINGVKCFWRGHLSTLIKTHQNAKIIEIKEFSELERQEL